MTIQDLINQLQSAIQQGHNPDTHICVYARSADSNLVYDYPPYFGLDINFINPYTGSHDTEFAAINFYHEHDEED